MNPIAKVFIGAHVGVFRMTGGRVGGHLMGLPVVLLTTTGRKTGKARTVPLMTLPDGDHFVIIASNNGAPTHPAWFNNLAANPEVTVEARGRKFVALAEIAKGDERTRLWNAVATKVPRYDGYKAKAGDREIPVVVLKEKR